MECFLFLPQSDLISSGTEFSSGTRKLVRIEHPNTLRDYLIPQWGVELFTEENTEKYISFFQDINVSLGDICRFSAYKTNVTGIF